jgi:hypothetical protein
MLMTFPDLLTPYFEGIEKSPARLLNERVCYSNLLHFLKDKPEALTPAVIAETTAFEFLENYTGAPSVWGTYYHPQFYQKEGDKVLQSPDITLLTEELLDYWAQRAMTTSHPVIKARYSGLICDFAQLITGRKADIKLVALCIESLIETFEQNLTGSAVMGQHKIERALKLALSYNQQTSIAKIKNLVLANDHAIPATEVKNIWAASFDLLLNRKPAIVSAVEEKTVIDLLESRLDVVNEIDPWAAKAAAERLAIYYKKRGQKADVKRVLDKLGRSFELYIVKVPAIQVAGHLQELMLIYRHFQLNREAEKLIVRIRTVSKNADEEFKKVVVEHDFETSELVGYAKQILKYDGDIMYQRIVHAQLMTTSEVEEDLERAVLSHPLRFFMTTSIVDKKGRVLAKLNPYAEDKEGHMVNHYYRFLQMNGAILLHFVFEVGIRDKKITTETVMDFLKLSCIIDKDRYGMIETGIQAFFDQHYLVCIHLLIPQFEEALRNLLEANGGNILTYNDHTYPVKTFLHVLEDPIVEEAFGPDQVYYFKMLFTDQRGWNLRNQVAHGLLEPELFNKQTAERLMHAFLCLGMIRWKDISLAE